MEKRKRTSRPFRRSPDKTLDWWISNYRRYKDFRPSVLKRVMEQVEENGFEYVLSTISDEARELYKGMCAVGCETHQAEGFLRFQDCGDTLIARAEFENNVVDVVLGHFMKRFPLKKVVIISDGVAYVGEDDGIREERSEAYTTLLEDQKQVKQEEDALWDTFYNSQYIDARRNRRLAMKAMPKKYWKRFGIEEGHEIDKGIPDTTLSDFI